MNRLSDANLPDPNFKFQILFCHRIVVVEIKTLQCSENFRNQANETISTILSFVYR